MALVKIKPYIIDETSDFTFNTVTSTGNVSAANATLGNLTTSNYFSGNGSLLTSLSGANVTGTVANASYATTSGTVTTNAQPNITSVGTLTSLSVTGNITSGNANLGNAVRGNFFIGDGGLLSNIQVGAGTAIVNGNSNVAVGANSNVTVGVSGTANVATFTSTGINVSGYTTLTGNLTSGNAALGNLATANFFSGNGSLLTSITGANVTGTVANATYATSAGTAGSATTAGTVTTNAQPNITSVGTLTSLSITGNLSSGNANLGNLATANFFSGNGSLLTSITGANVTGTVANATYADSTGSAGTSTTAGTVTTNAQPNITSVGTLSSLAVTGNANVGNVNATNGLFTGNLTVQGNTIYVNVDTLNVEDPIIEMGGGPNNAPLTTNDGKDRGSLLHYYTTQPVDAFMGWDNSNSEFGFGSNVSLTNEVVTWNSYGNIRAGHFLGNGSLLTGTIANANYATNAGTADSATTAGTVTTNAQPNITSVGTLSSLSVTGNITSGNANLGNAVTANFFIGDGGYLSNIQVGAGTAIVNGNSNVAVGANSNVTVGVSGTSNVVVVTSTGINVSGYTTLTGNLTAGNANLGNLVTANFVSGNGSLLTSITGANVIGTVANATNATTATTAGTVTTNAQPNITSVGTLSSLTVSGLLTATGTGVRTANIQDSTGTITITTRYNSIAGDAGIYGNLTVGTSGTGSFIGNGSGLTSLPGANVTGTVANATYATSTGTADSATTAGTVTTNAQPNITSVGTLTSLSVTGNLSAGNANLGNLATANFFSGNGSLLTSITGANVTGTVANATYAASAGTADSATTAGTVTTNAQPNITSIGTLSNLTSNGTVNFTNASNVSLGAVGNVKITGGSSGQVLRTDGTGNLTWVDQSGGGGTPGGSNTQVQFNDGNTFGGNAGFTFNKSTTTLTANNFIATSTANLGAVGNITITGGSADYVLKTDGSGNLSWTQQTGGEAANIVVDTFTGNGVQTVFTLSVTPDGINSTVINYSGAILQRDSYSLSGANVTFDSAPANGSKIEVTTTAIANVATFATTGKAIAMAIVFGF